MRTFHVHKKYEIYYQVDGTRRYYIDEAAYLINAGNVVLIGPYGVHKTGSVENCGHTRFVLNFNKEYLEKIATAFPDVDLFACFDGGLPVLNVPLKKQSYLENLLERLWAQSKDTSPSAEALRHILVADLLLTLQELVVQTKEKDTAPRRISNKTIDKIQSYISTHYKEALSLTQIASQFYISPYYLSHLFKKTTNLSIVEYINSVRIMAAKNLLETTDLKVAAVAEETGFSTTAHFSRVFKEGTGLSPQQYRKYYQTTLRNT